MSTNHGETIMQKPISEYAKYFKKLLPMNIPETYAIKPMFNNIASDENIRSGVIAFRDFLHLFFDRLISEGHLYAKPQKTKNLTSYPFLHHVNHLLIDIGYHSQLTESGGSLLITEIPSLIAPKPKIPASKQMECLRFLELCGFNFTGIDLKAKKLNIPEGQLLEVLYPNNPILLTGLRVLSIADIQLRARRYNNDDHLLRCDYRLLKAEETDLLDVLQDFLQPLPKNLQKFALELHQRYITMGMTCVMIVDDQYHFAYSYIQNNRRALSEREIYQRRIWEFAISMKHGYILAVRAKKTDKYTDVIENLHLSLQEKIAKGYGCDRKRNERCQGGCQGILIPLDESILEIKEDLKMWLDHELPQSLKK